MPFPADGQRLWPGQTFERVGLPFRATEGGGKGGRGRRKTRLLRAHVGRGRRGTQGCTLARPPPPAGRSAGVKSARPIRPSVARGRRKTPCQGLRWEAGPCSPWPRSLDGGRSNRPRTLRRAQYVDRRWRVVCLSRRTGWERASPGDQPRVPSDKPRGHAIHDRFARPLIPSAKRKRARRRPKSPQRQASSEAPDAAGFSEPVAQSTALLKPLALHDALAEAGEPLSGRGHALNVALDRRERKVDGHVEVGRDENRGREGRVRLNERRDGGSRGSGVQRRGQVSGSARPVGDVYARLTSQRRCVCRAGGLAAAAVEAS
jgi:hypothetical protein